MEMFDLLTLKV